MSVRPVSRPRYFLRGFGVGVGLVGLTTLGLLVAPFVLSMGPSW